MKGLALKSMVLGLVGVLALAGACGKKADNAGGGGTGAADSSDAVREIVFWDMMWGPAAAYPAASQKLVDRFNAENTENIHVKLQIIPWDNYYQVFLTAVSSGSAPDVATGSFVQPVQYADMGETVPLDPILEQWKKENHPILSEIPENIWNLHMFGGKHCGLPWNLDTRQMLYRKDYFEQAGITKLPTTWAEMEEVFAKLKKALPPDVFPIIFPGGGDHRGLHPLITLLVQNDAGLSNKEGTGPDFLNSRVTEVLRFLNRMYVNGYVPEGVAAYKPVDAEKLYQAGKAAMFMHNSMNMSDFPELKRQFRDHASSGGSQRYGPKLYLG